MTTYRIRIFAARPVDRERPYPGVGSASPREVYHRLLARGEDWRTAATLTAWIVGLRCFEGEEIAWTWRICEVERLAFLRHLAEQGRIGGPAG